MCHGQLVNEALLTARSSHTCRRCKATIQKAAEFYKGTVRSFDDGLLSNFTLCTTCAGLDESYGQGMNCRLRDDDVHDPFVKKVIQRGLNDLRRRLMSMRRAH